MGGDIDDTWALMRLLESPVFANLLVERLALDR
jgi:hypothetical protein